MAISNRFWGMIGYQINYRTIEDEEHEEQHDARDVAFGINGFDDLIAKVRDESGGMQAVRVCAAAGGGGEAEDHSDSDERGGESVAGATRKQALTNTFIKAWEGGFSRAFEVRSFEWRFVVEGGGGGGG